MEDAEQEGDVTDLLALSQLWAREDVAKTSHDADDDHGGSNGVLVPVCLDLGLAEDLEELAHVQALASARLPCKRWRPRSWEHAKNARDAKKRKALEGQLQLAKDANAQVKTRLAILSNSCPSVAKSLGLKPSELQLCLKEKGGEQLLAQVSMHLAAVSSVGSSACESSAQIRAISRSGACIQEVMRDSAESILLPAMPSDLIRVVNIPYQWDETLQSCRAPMPFVSLSSTSSFSSSKSRASTGAVKVQTMVQSGKLMVFEYSDPALAPDVQRESPWLRRPMFLWRQSANHILEGLLRSFPIDLADRAKMLLASQSSDAVVFVFLRDGASANGLTCKYIFFLIRRLGTPNLFPFSMLCFLHLCAIARSRIKGVQSVINAIISFTRWIRVNRNQEALSSSLRHVVRGLLKVTRQCRPEKYRKRSEHVFKILFTSLGCDEYMWKEVNGQREMTTFHHELLNYLAVVDMPGAGEAGEVALTHWCNVEEGSAEAAKGLPLGTPCCATWEDSVEKVLEPISTFLAGRAWVQMVISRWTHVPQGSRRALLASIGPGLLPKALDHLRTSWDVSDSIEGQLARLVEIDRDDFKSQNKLRLLRFSRTLCNPSTPIELAASTISSRVVDCIMYSLLGHRERARVGIMDLMKPRTSVVTLAQVETFKLLSDWTPDEENPWFVLASFGMDFSDRALRLRVRSQVLQSSAGVLGSYELRMQKAPYSLTIMCMEEVAADVIDQVFLELESEPRECLPLFMRLWLDLFPTRALQLTKGKAVIRSWAASDICIDFSERSHGSMRQDLGGAGSARNPTLSSNRVFMKMVKAAHRAAGGGDVILPCSEQLQLRDKSRKNPKNLGGNPRMEHFNSKAHALKQLHAPDRPLTSDERSRFKDIADSEWESIVLEEQSHAAWVAKFEAAQASRRLVGTVVASHARAEAQEMFQGLWGDSVNKADLLSPESMVQKGLHKASNRAEQRKALHDEELCVRAEVRDRIAEVPVKELISEDGCFACKKNVCRTHRLSVREAHALDDLTRRVNEFVDSCGKRVVEEANLLLNFIGRRTDDEPDSDALMHFFLLTDARYSPKVQIFCRCELAADSSSQNALELQLPFDIKLSARAPRLPGNAHLSVLDLKTSDEICYAMVSQRPIWDFRKAHQDIKCDVDSLLFMTVSGFDPCHDREKNVSKKPTANKHSISSSLPAELDISDPFGEPCVQNTAPFVSRLLGGDLEEHLQVPAEEDHSTDLIRNMAEGDPNCDLDALRAVLEPESEDLDSRLAAAELEADQMPDVAAGAGEEVEELESVLSLFDAVRASSISGLGYVKCPAAPWNCKATAGRLTTWPTEKPLSQRSVSMRCYYHPKCSVAKGRWQVTDNELLCWLLSVDTAALEGAGSARKESLGHAHMASWRRDTFPKMDLASGSGS